MPNPLFFHNKRAYIFHLKQQRTELLIDLKKESNNQKLIVAFSKRFILNFIFSGYLPLEMAHHSL